MSCQVTIISTAMRMSIEIHSKTPCTWRELHHGGKMNDNWLAMDTIQRVLLIKEANHVVSAS
jgi:hypothetical protein